MSAYIFVIHPVVREIFLNTQQLWIKTPYVAVLIYTSISILFSIPIKKGTEALRQWATK